MNGKNKSRMNDENTKIATSKWGTFINLRGIRIINWDNRKGEKDGIT
jgi:hypothetical protein